jgi:hypothetical protein
VLLLARELDPEPRELGPVPLVVEVLLHCPLGHDTRLARDGNRHDLLLRGEEFPQVSGAVAREVVRLDQRLEHAEAILEARRERLEDLVVELGAPN